jgi:hypothetical protein
MKNNRCSSEDDSPSGTLSLVASPPKMHKVSCVRSGGEEGGGEGGRRGQKMERRGVSVNDG